jgi:uncharacterized membrane protein
MKFSKFVSSRLVAGVLVVTPIYLAALVLLKAAKSLSVLVKPFARILPDWFPAEQILSLLFVLTGCFLIGVAIRTAVGLAVWGRIENTLIERLPGYTLFRSLTQRLAGETKDNKWKPALAEIEEALVPAFIIEELEDGRFTVFVPSVPTILAGSIYILTADRVHPLSIPFTQAVRAVSRWGSGSGDLIAAMETKENHDRTVPSPLS